MLEQLALSIRRFLRGKPRWMKEPLNFWLRRYGDPPTDPR